MPSSSKPQQSASSRQVKCPRCGKAAVFAPENPFRPFCSERCKMIDLGEWAEGKYAIPVEGSAPVDASGGLQSGTEGENSDGIDD